jgi:hypothetical protein
LKCTQLYDVFSTDGNYNKTICLAQIRVAYVTGYDGQNAACVKQGARPFRPDSSEALIAAQNLFNKANLKAASLYIEKTTNSPESCSIISYNPVSSAVSLKTALCTYQSFLFCEFIKGNL